MSPGEVVSTVTGTSAYIRRRLQADIDGGVKVRRGHGTGLERGVETAIPISLT